MIAEVLAIDDPIALEPKLFYFPVKGGRLFTVKTVAPIKVHPQFIIYAILKPSVVC